MRISDHFHNNKSNPVEEASEYLPTALEPTQRLDDVRKFGLFSG